MWSAALWVEVSTISDPLSEDLLYKRIFLIYPLRMDMDRDKMAEMILHLTLEILLRLTGEDYTVVKKTSSERCQDPVSEGLGRPLSPITGPPPHPLIHEDINDQKILELTYKMIELLTGQVSTISDPLSEDLLYKRIFLIYPLRMDMDRDKMAERILHLTLEILLRLTGEDYTVVKKTSSERCQDPVSEGWGRPQSPITVPPPHPLIHEAINDQKILELTYKMIELLTGENASEVGNIMSIVSYLCEYMMIHQHPISCSPKMPDGREKFICPEFPSSRKTTSGKTTKGGFLFFWDMDFRAKDKAWLCQIDQVFGVGEAGSQPSVDQTVENQALDIERLLINRTRLWWNRAFLERYISNRLIPRGLRVRVIPAFPVEDEEEQLALQDLEELAMEHRLGEGGHVMNPNG
ncbi:uncharacterized protein LOC143768231 [Ranitomeya variabilis]|uniref:uncharacterized protein LOC143768231 n=1 Tax=Ranitomeya variabilis TaxID=490064 RepID=UPI0040568ED1